MGQILHVNADVAMKAKQPSPIVRKKTAGMTILDGTYLLNIAVFDCLLC